MTSDMNCDDVGVPHVNSTITIGNINSSLLWLAETAEEGWVTHFVNFIPL